MFCRMIEILLAYRGHIDSKKVLHSGTRLEIAEQDESSLTSPSKEVDHRAMKIKYVSIEQAKYALDRIIALKQLSITLKAW
jgi:hypothetical protein